MVTIFDYDAEPLASINLDSWEAPVGVQLLDDVERFLSRFVAYPSDSARVAHVLWVVHTHRMDLWESTPRIAFLSPEPGSGKSRALEITELLVPNAVHTVNTTPAYLFRKVADEEGGLPTLLYDEIDTVFGPRAKDNEDIRGMLNAGHRRGAVAGRCVVRGKTVLTEDLPAYCAVALAGLDDMPDTIMSRSIVVRMRRRAPTETIEPFRHRLHALEGHQIRDRLATWTQTMDLATWPELPIEIEDRSADCWEALVAVADAAGGTWPERSRCAAVTLVTASKAAPHSLGVRLLNDLKTVFDNAGGEHLFTDDILRSLCALDLSPWVDVQGQALNARGLATRLGKYEVKPGTVRVGGKTAKGYSRSQFHDAWSRYATAQAHEVSKGSEEHGGEVTTGSGPSHLRAVTSVTSVTAGTWGRPAQPIPNTE